MRRLRHAQLLDLDDALTALDSFDARKAKVVELRFFGGLTIDEGRGSAQKCPPTRWRETGTFAKTWLYREMTRPPSGGAGSAGKGE